MGSTRSSTSTRGTLREFTDDERRQMLLARESMIAGVSVTKIKGVHKAMSIKDPLETSPQVESLIRYAAQNGLDHALQPEAERVAFRLTGQGSWGVLDQTYDFSGLESRINTWIDTRLPSFAFRYREEPRGNGISDYYIR